MIKPLIQRFINLTLFQILSFVFFGFVGHATLDIILKTNEMSKYDMQKIMSEIQKEYPGSDITFQNIYIEDNDRRKGTRSRSRFSSETYYYYAKNYLYIRNNQFHQEPKYLPLMVFLFMLLAFLPMSCLNIKKIKLKELKNIHFGPARVLGIIITAIIVIIFTFDVDTFEKSSLQYANQINLSDYQIHQPHE
ncbi:hypothetical protein LX69_03471 [Breznakibacter xylanolyticus]|uniref:Uncharacterized protein n=1 Tax=Breznakibacter xylanolyticus TaxID=990 RepID=A0A2W7NAF8_9BACT|nr:hypothetical protein [Breznakibacter xylanolyticus]PZX09966.1 hypothetical protein LX69_03471 [Breznakibacter xylanolyticus]